MSGTTLCPHCNTRFKIAEAQLVAHHGMVRCGQCLQAFDARPGFVPDQPNLQLELPMLDEKAAPANALPIDEPPATETALTIKEAMPVEEAGLAEKTGVKENGAAEAVLSVYELTAETVPPDSSHEETPGSDQPAVAPAGAGEDVEAVAPQPSDEVAQKPLTLAEQVAIVQDEDDSQVKPERRTWPWALASLLLLLVLIAQAAYFFRIELAARLPDLKPALLGYCQLLKCSVPLPQNTDLVGIESSDLEADPAHESQIVLSALIRNRAPYAQAFPSLELTLNDTQDKPLARRTFKPKDYLPPQENELTGLLPNHELSIKLPLDTADLKPVGYRLVLFYHQA